MTSPRMSPSRSRSTGTTTSSAHPARNGLPPWMTRATRDRELHEQRVRARIQHLQHEPWKMYTCGRGHQFEIHRSTLDAEPRCPTCGDLAAHEPERETALRELRDSLNPLRLIEQMADTLAEWGARHLNATTWTQRSENLREQRTRGPAFGRDPLFQKWR